MGVSARTIVKTWEKPKRFPFGNSTARPSPGKKSQPNAKWNKGDPRPQRSRTARATQNRRAMRKTSASRSR